MANALTTALEFQEAGDEVHAVEEADVPFVSDFKDHASVRGLVTGGFQVITF